VQAGERGDPMLGTAFPASRLLLVEQPGPWGRTGLLDSRFDRAAAHRLVARMNRLQVRVVSIRPPGRASDDGPRRWALVDCRLGGERLVWGRFHDDGELTDLDVQGILGHRTTADAGLIDDAAPVYLVCAHGTHDVCCAIRGRPVAAALSELRPGRVWECSHVGGDRFAANVLVLPSGMLYGRVVAPAAPALVDATERGSVVEQHLRGRVGFAPEVQAAIALAHRERPGLTIADVRPVASRSLAPDLSVVRLWVGDELVEAQVRIEQTSTEWLTCQASEPSRANVYQPLSFQRVNAGDQPSSA
jgi:(2Fe-2S) ferredoxin